MGDDAIRDRPMAAVESQDKGRQEKGWIPMREVRRGGGRKGGTSRATPETLSAANASAFAEALEPAPGAAAAEIAN